MATCSVSYTPKVTGKHLISGAYGGDSSHETSSGSFTLNVRIQRGGPVLLTFNGFELDDFDNGVGQLQVLVNGQLVVDIPAGLNHLTGSGDFDAYDTNVFFGPFDITSFVVPGRNSIRFTDPNPFDHFGIVSNVTIVQDGSALLHVSRGRGVDHSFSFSYTFSSPALTLTSFAPFDSANNVVSVASLNQPLTFTVAYNGGAGPFICFFSFRDGDFAVVVGSNGTCAATHAYDSSGKFNVTVTVRGMSMQDLVRGQFRVVVTSDPSSTVVSSSAQTGDIVSQTS